MSSNVVMSGDDKSLITRLMDGGLKVIEMGSREDAIVHSVTWLRYAKIKYKDKNCCILVGENLESGIKQYLNLLSISFIDVITVSANNYEDVTESLILGGYNFIAILTIPYKAHNPNNPEFMMFESLMLRIDNVAIYLSGVILTNEVKGTVARLITSVNSGVMHIDTSVTTSLYNSLLDDGNIVLASFENNCCRSVELRSARFIGKDEDGECIMLSDEEALKILDMRLGKSDVGRVTIYSEYNFGKEIEILQRYPNIRRVIFRRDFL